MTGVIRCSGQILERPFTLSFVRLIQNGNKDRFERFPRMSYPKWLCLYLKRLWSIWRESESGRNEEMRIIQRRKLYNSTTCPI